MGKHVPIEGEWILARPKVKFYGAYPAGFLHRARALLGVQLDDPVLHVCSGLAHRYPMRGFGPRDRTVDLDPRVRPDWVMDVRERLPRCPYDARGWRAQIADPPYSEEDASHYLGGEGAEFYPNPGDLLRRMFENARPGGRVGFLHYLWPAPPKIQVPGVKSKVEGIMRDGVPLRIWQVACVAVIVGYRNRMRTFGVWELGLPPASAACIEEVRRDVFTVRRVA